MASSVGYGDGATGNKKGGLRRPGRGEARVDGELKLARRDGGGHRASTGAGVVHEVNVEAAVPTSIVASPAPKGD